MQMFYLIHWKLLKYVQNYIITLYMVLYRNQTGVNDKSIMAHAPLKSLYLTDSELAFHRAKLKKS